MGKYVTDANVFLNVQRLSSTQANHVASVAQAIVEAERWIDSELLEPLDGQTIPELTDSPTTPGVIQNMALWKASGISLMKIFGGEGKEDSPPGNHWNKWAEDTLEEILTGKKRIIIANNVAVGPAANDFDTNKEIEDSPDGIERVKPYLGYGQDGEFIETTSGVEDRSDIDVDAGQDIHTGP